MADKVQLECGECGHDWRGKPIEERETRPRCSECSASGDSIQEVGQPEKSSPDETESESESVESDPEPDSHDHPAHPLDAPASEPRSRQRPPASERISPPRPEEYGAQTAEPEDELTPRAVFEDVIRMFPTYGSSVSKEAVVEYLKDMADYHGTPTPDDLYDWVVRFQGVGDSTAADLKDQYDDTLDHQMQRDKLDPAQVQELFGYGSPSRDDVDERGAAPARRGSRAAARADPSRSVGGSGPPQRPQGESKAKVRAVEQATRDEVPEPVRERLDRADVGPGVKDLAREMYLIGRDSAKADRSSSQSREPEPTRRQQQEPRQPGQPRSNGDSQSGEAGGLVESIDQVLKLEQKLDEMRGDDHDATEQEITRLQQQLAAVAEQVNNDDPEHDHMSGEIEELVINSDLPVNEKKELLGSAARDPETIKLEKRYDRLESLLDKGENVLSGLLAKDDEGQSLLYHVGQYRAGLRDALEEREEPPRDERPPPREGEREPRRREPPAEDRRRDAPPADDRRRGESAAGRQVEVADEEPVGRRLANEVREGRRAEEPPAEQRPPEEDDVGGVPTTAPSDEAAEPEPAPAPEEEDVDGDATDEGALADADVDADPGGEADE